MTQEILNAIANSLPKMQMDALSKELDKASNYDSVCAQRDEYQKKIYELERQVSDLTGFKRNYEHQVAELVKAENTLEISLLKKDIDCERRINNAVMELTRAAFRNPTVTKSYQIPVSNMGFTAPVLDMTTVD